MQANFILKFTFFLSNISLTIKFWGKINTGLSRNNYQTFLNLHFNVRVRGIPAQNNIEFELICRLRSSSGINVVIDISSLVWASHLRTIIFLTYPVQYKKFPFSFFTDFSSTYLRANFPTIEKSHFTFFF